MTTIRDRLALSAAEGTFFQAIAELSRGELVDDDDTLAREIADGHNAGLFNAVAAFRQLKKSEPDFWLIRHALEKALPDLCAPVPEVMLCCDTLAKEDGAILNAYASFLARDPSRFEHAVREIESNNDLASLLIATLVAGSRTDPAGILDHVLKLEQHANATIRASAIAALARLDGSIPATAAVKAMLKRIASSELEDLIAAAVVSALSHYAQSDSHAEFWTDLAQGIVASAGDQTLHAATEALCDGEKLPKSFRDALLVGLDGINPANTGTLARLDLACYTLVKADHNAVVNVLTLLLLKHHGKVSMQTFTHTASAIRQDPKFVGRMLTQWFLSGERVLCEAARDLVMGYRGNVPRLEMDIAQADPSDSLKMVFLARKTVGYLFFRPAIVTAIVVSLVAVAPLATAKDIGQLLFETVLVNYSGEAQAALRREMADRAEPLRSLLEGALQQLAAYLAQLPEGPVLGALQPSQSHREIQMRRRNAQFRAAAAQAESQSVLASLFKKSVMLYGRSSIHYIHGPGQEPRRMQTPLQKHGVRTEVPRMSIVDPVGLDLMLRIFRAERLKK